MTGTGSSGFGVREATAPAPVALVTRHVAEGIPLLIRGGLSGWRPRLLLDLESLADRFGHRPVRVHRAPLRWTPQGQFDRVAAQRIGRPGQGPGRGMQLLTLSLQEAVAGVLGDFTTLSPATYAVAAASLTTTIPPLAGGVAPPAPVEALGPTVPYLWLGPRGKTVPLHVDGASGMLGQVEGRKRVHLLPPGDPGAYPGSINTRMSRIPDLRRVDPGEFPRFTARRVRSCVIDPGDLLHVPHGWWHQVDYLDAAVSVNFWPPGYLRPGRPTGR
ncbi:MAG: cupin-like domain-containing protein [Acidimicrobiales bacterium]